MSNMLRRQCRDMLHWNVAIVWPELGNVGPTMLEHFVQTCLRSFGRSLILPLKKNMVLRLMFRLARRRIRYSIIVWFWYEMSLRVLTKKRYSHSSHICLELFTAPLNWYQLSDCKRCAKILILRDLAGCCPCLTRSMISPSIKIINWRFIAFVRFISKTKLP